MNVTEIEVSAVSFAPIWSTTWPVLCCKQVRNYVVGESLSIRELDEQGKKQTGRIVFARVAAVLRSQDADMPTGYVLLGLSITGKGPI